jgi:sRNA-binding carbon storage regulator CsrA
MSSLKYDMRVGDTIKLDGGKIKITLLDKSGQRARLDINAENSVTIETPSTVKAHDLAKNGVNLKRS